MNLSFLIVTHREKKNAASAVLFPLEEKKEKEASDGETKGQLTE